MSIAFLQFETKSWCYRAHEVGIVGMPVSIRGAAEHTSMQLESVVLGSMRPDTHLSFLCAHKTIGVPPNAQPQNAHTHIHTHTQDTHKHTQHVLAF